MFQNQYSSSALCAFLNSGRVSIPLSHSHALETIAALEGARDWNAVAQRADVELLKSCAKSLRTRINALLAGMGLPISETDAALVLDAAVSDDLAAPGAPARPLHTEVAPSAQPIGIEPGHDEHEWRVCNPNALAGEQLDSLVAKADRTRGPVSPATAKEIISHMRRLAQRYPGDVECLHSLALLCSDHGDQSEALTIWRSARLLLSPAMEKMRAQDKRANLSYNFLENRPVLRSLHGLACGLMKLSDPASLAEAESLTRLLYELMRDRDSFGCRSLHASALAASGKWSKVLSWVKHVGAEEFDLLALQIAALFHLNDPKLGEAQMKLIRLHPFAVEVLLRGQRPSNRDPVYVSQGTWQEGDSFLRLCPTALQPAEMRKMWLPFRRQIRSSQEAWLTRYWTEYGHLDSRSVSALYHSMVFSSERIVPDSSRVRPVTPSVLPATLPIPVAYIDVPGTQKLTLADFERWIINRDPGLPTKGRFLEWLLHHAVRGSVNEITIVPGSRKCGVFFDKELFASLKPEYGQASIDIVFFMTGRTRNADNETARFRLKTSAESETPEYLVEARWDSEHDDVVIRLTR